MSTEVSTTQLLRGYSRFFHRYHFVIFVVLAFGGLAIVILLLNQTIQSSTDTTDTVQEAIAGFDTQTIGKLRGLQQTGSSETLQFPNTRINPFVE